LKPDHTDKLLELKPAKPGGYLMTLWE